MDVIVCVKHVPETAEAEIKISPEGKNIDKGGLVFDINEWDDYALEEAVRIKEKFGGLRFYYSGGDSIIEGAIDFAEFLSYRICEKCGSTNNVTQTKGWITSLCENCMKEVKK